MVYDTSTFLQSAFSLLAFSDVSSHFDTRVRRLNMALCIFPKHIYEKYTKMSASNNENDTAQFYHPAYDLFILIRI